MEKVLVFLLHILHENTFQVDQRSKLFFFKLWKSQKKTQKNAYNLWIEFLNKMENIKAIKEKIGKCDYIKTVTSVQDSPRKVRQVADRKIFQYM